MIDSFNILERFRRLYSPLINNLKQHSIFCETQIKKNKHQNRIPKYAMRCANQTIFLLLLQTEYSHQLLVTIVS